jgi:hypothetical protein
VFIGIGELLKPPYTHDGHQMVADAEAFYQILQSHPSAKTGSFTTKAAGDPRGRSFYGFSNHRHSWFNLAVQAQFVVRSIYGNF